MLHLEKEMDSYLVWFFSAFAFLVAYFVWKQLRGKNTSTLNLPPSPKALPFIGHIHLLGPLLHRSLRELSEQCGPLMSLKLGSTVTIVVSSPAMAKELLHTQGNNFAGRVNLRAAEVMMYHRKSIGSLPNGPVWKDLRKLSKTELFTANRVSSFMVLVQRELMELLSHVLERSRNDRVFEIRTALRDFSFNATTRILMSKVYYGAKAREESGAKEAAEFVECVEEVMENMAKILVGDMFPKLAWVDNLWILPKLRKLHRKVDDFLQKTLEQHRLNGNSAGDIVDNLDTFFGIEKQEFTKATLLDLTLGGTDTSSTLTEWALGELINHPEVMLKVQQELESVIGMDRLVEVSDLSKLEYLNAVIRETFRLHPPVPIVFRSNASACQVNGYHIPQDSFVFFNVHGIGRDPEVWKSPEEFCPERFFETSISPLGNDFELIPFGAGRRICVGLPLGMKNVELALANLLHGFDWSLPSGKNHHSMLEVLGMVSYMADPLEVKVKPRLADHLFTSICNK